MLEESPFFLLKPLKDLCFMIGKKNFFGLKYISEAVPWQRSGNVDSVLLLFPFSPPFFKNAGSIKVQNVNAFATSLYSGWAPDLILLNTLHNNITFTLWDILQHLSWTSSDQRQPPTSIYFWHLKQIDTHGIWEFLWIMLAQILQTTTCFRKMLTLESVTFHWHCVSTHNGW